MLIHLAEHPLTLPESAHIAHLPGPWQTATYLEAAIEAMDHPIDISPLGQWDLRGKRVAVLVDDWGRPTPCGEFLPAVLERLNKAGAEDKDITIVTASGMHDPMSDADLVRKVGPEAFRRVRCVSHDGGNREMLEFCGITDLGTPVWVNKYAAQADFRMIIGRIYPHGNYGYEGGYKMIVPGIASFETILRDHSLNFSALSSYGKLKNNPSRAEADAVGRLVGVHFAVNFVVDWDARPVKAFGGTVEAIFPAGVAFGQKNIWVATTGGRPADITVLCHKEMGDLSLSNNPNYFIGLASSVTAPEGIIISTMEYAPMKRNIVCGYDLDELSFSELIRLHEKRDWNLDRRQIQHVIKGIRGAFYKRRELEYRPQKLFFVSGDYPRRLLEKWNATQFPTLQAAFDAAAREKQKPHVFVIPDAKHTLPLIHYDYE